jgi:hypothetical protein
MPNAFPVCFVSCCSLLPLMAQANESRGVLSGAATAVLVDGGLAGSADAETRVHRNGFGLAPTQAMPAATNPYDLRPILVANGAPAGLDVDDYSLGRDDVLVDSGGFVQVPTGAWGVLSFSLRQGATGAAGSRIATEVQAGSVGAALFSWVLPGSALPPQLVARTERSHSRSELGLPAGTVEVDAVDFPTVLGLDQGNWAIREPNFAALIATPEAIYFTVSHATRQLVPVGWWGPGNPLQLRSGATILSVTRSQLGTPWSPPFVFRHWFELGLDQDEDIDGLAYDAARERLLFSCVGNQRDQLLSLDLGTDGPPAPTPVKMPPTLPAPSGGAPVSTQIGKGQNDDVDAVCTLDPRLGSLGSPPTGGDDFGSSCGAPRPGLLGVPAVHAAAYRRFEGGQAWFDTFVVGWPPSSGVGPGVVALFVTLGDSLDLIPVGPIQLRNPTSGVPGDPKTYALAIPPGFALGNQRLTFRWVAIDGGFTELAEAWPVQVFL